MSDSVNIDMDTKVGEFLTAVVKHLASDSADNQTAIQFTTSMIADGEVSSIHWQLAITHLTPQGKLN